MSSYSLENKAFGSLLVHGGLAITKSLLMTPITIYFRRKYRSVASLEDARFYAPGREDKQRFLLQPKEEVERVSFMDFLQLCAGGDVVQLIIERLGKPWFDS